MKIVYRKGKDRNKVFFFMWLSFEPGKDINKQRVRMFLPSILEIIYLNMKSGKRNKCMDVARFAV